MAEIFSLPGSNSKVPIAVDTVRRDDAIAQVRALEKQIVGSEGEACRLRMAQGDVLIPIRDSLGHGRWLPFLADCRLSVRNAQLAMQLAGKREEIEAANAKSSSHLSIAAALKLIRPAKPPKPAGDALPVDDGPDRGDGQHQGSEDLFWEGLRTAADDDLLGIILVDELSRDKAERVAREILQDGAEWRTHQSATYPDPYVETLQELPEADRRRVIAGLGITKADVPASIVTEIEQHVVARERKVQQFIKKVRSVVATSEHPARQIENIKAAIDALDAGGALPWYERMDPAASGFKASTMPAALDPTHPPTKH